MKKRLAELDKQIKTLESGSTQKCEKLAKNDCDDKNKSKKKYTQYFN